MVQVNVEAIKIDILRKEKFGRRIRRIGKQSAWRYSAAQGNEVFDEFRDAADAKPANHLRRNLIANEIGQQRGMIIVRFDRTSYGTSDFSARGFIPQEFDVLCPW